MKITKRASLPLLFIIGSFLLFSACGAKKEKNTEFKVIGYLFNKKVPIDSLAYQYLTHINYSFAIPTKDASGRIEPIPFPDRLTELSKTAHAHGAKVFISIGGWAIGDGGGNDTRFEVLADNPESRTTFVKETMEIVRKFNLDGVDIDWEYPNPIEPSSTNFVLLMKQLSDSLHAAGKKLSAAIVSHDDRYGYGIKEKVFPYVDWMNIMTYDFKNGENRSHSPYYLAVHSFDYWVDDRGLPDDKAVLGLNFGPYGRAIRLKANPHADSYISNKGLGGGRGGINNITPDTLYYNGITTVKAKTRLAMERGAGGIMMWAVARDVNGEYSLLKAINKVILESK